MCAPRPARALPSVWNCLQRARPYMPKGAILVVDDEAEIREGLAELLALEGFEVTTAESAEIGLQKLEADPFDLILLDFNLPGLNGLDMLETIEAGKIEI